jgi:hypothetical protein
MESRRLLNLRAIVNMCMSKFITGQVDRLKATKSAIVEKLPKGRYKITAGLKTVEIGPKDDELFYQFLSEVNV